MNLSKEMVFIDGTKLEACANKYAFVWKKSVGKRKEKMFRKIQDSIQHLNHEYIQDFSVVQKQGHRIYRGYPSFWKNAHER